MNKYLGMLTCPKMNVIPITFDILNEMRFLMKFHIKDLFQIDIVIANIHSAGCNNNRELLKKRRFK